MITHESRTPMMRTAVLLLNFGEPETATPGAVIPFLERIFCLNAPLMGPATPEQVREHSRALAEARAPGLIEEYERIWGSPLHRQAHAQAEALTEELRQRGHDAVVLAGMQFTDPSIGEVVARVRGMGVGRVVGVPLYPLPGPSTTVAALEEMRRHIRLQEWEPEVREITGWQRHPEYLRLRADAIRALLAENGLSLEDPQTALVFSAHGTPIRYLEEGSRYDLYVRDFCALLAQEVRAPGYELGYQNHTHRPGVQWTQPDVERVVAEIDARHVIVDPISFMHEQSETLAELDHELRQAAEASGLAFHRVPIPYGAPAFVRLLAELVEPFLGTGRSDAMATGTVPGPLSVCLFRTGEDAYCLNAAVPQAASAPAGIR